MTKTAPLKKKKLSIHSRAARRATSPGIDLDKSLKNVRPPPESLNHRPSVLAIHKGAGVTKKVKNGRKSVLSAKARRRQEKGLDRAEVVTNKTEVKVQKSKGRARTVQERRKAWEELNRKLPLRNNQTKTELSAGMEGRDDDIEVVDNGEADQVAGLDHAVIDGVEELQVSSMTLAESRLPTASDIPIEDGEVL